MADYRKSEPFILSGEQGYLSMPHDGSIEPVLAVMARQENGQWLKILNNQPDHEQFYRSA